MYRRRRPVYGDDDDDDDAADAAAADDDDAGVVRRRGARTFTFAASGATENATCVATELGSEGYSDNRRRTAQAAVNKNHLIDDQAGRAERPRFGDSAAPETKTGVMSRGLRHVLETSTQRNTSGKTLTPGCCMS